MMFTPRTLLASVTLRSIMLPFAMAIAAFSMTTANADLVIHNEPTTKIAQTSTDVSAMPTDTSVIKLMKVMRIDEQIASVINGQQAAIEVINERTKTGGPAKDDDNLNERQRVIRDQVQGLLGQYAKIMTGSIGEATDSETMTQAYITAAKAYYTQDEVDAQIKFYDTPIGQRILDKQPQVTAAFLKQSLPKDMGNAEEQLGELLPQVKKIFKDIF